MSEFGKSPFGDDDSFWKDFSEFKNNFNNKDTVEDDGDAVNARDMNVEVQRHNPWKTPIQYALAVILAALPISFYLFQSGSFDDIADTSRQSLQERDTQKINEELDLSLGDTKTAAASPSSTSDITEEAITNRSTPDNRDAAVANRSIADDREAAVANRSIADDREAAVANRSIADDREAAIASRSRSNDTKLKTASRSKLRPTESVKDVLNDTALEHAAKHAAANYVCPMHPSVITSDPTASCPICGMKLVLLEAGGDSGVVSLTPTMMNSLGVRTAKVRRRTLYRRIDSVGYINVDENNIRVISLRTDGWVENLLVKTAGERVTKGQLLFEIYSPTLVNAQDEFVQAMGHNNDLMLNASKERLKALGVSDEQIAELAESKEVEHLVKVYAPQSGIVAELNIREGVYVKPSQTIINLVDLSSVWLMVDVFERQAAWVEQGQRAEATMPFLPGQAWSGTVEYVYPSLDAATRSLKVRLRFDNLKEELKPNMYADVTIFAQPKKDVLTIPREALIQTGKEKRVIVALGNGKFMPMPVQVGMETDTGVEVLQGLAENDDVVTSSQFLIDSESSLKASLAKMSGG